MSTATALDELKKGKMIVIYDSDQREGEADLVFHASAVTPERIETMRKDAGGLLCVAIDQDPAKKAKLPFFTDILEKADVSVKVLACKKTAYGDKPAFSLPVNHCQVYTGITDNDRALTIKKLHEVLGSTSDATLANFSKEFYSPGHIFLLIGRGLKNRRGHTELTLKLAELAGLSGVMVLCEMLGKGKALSKNDAMAYAKKNGLIFLEGKEIVDATS
ncbi:3,4-dihydroxy-2-butanone-4-phosphate synthase [Candidatus Micrarchaeota archaeon]|nr:3,4-dihydroxy-2-butanone-4-phosphate synthase [Candidatus Micrarchaeota archaeon]